MQVEVVFVCLVMRFRWQASLIMEHLSPFAWALSEPSAPLAAAVNIKAPMILFWLLDFLFFYRVENCTL